MTDELDVGFLSRIAAVETRVKDICDMIPIANWGFTDDVQQELRESKHTMVSDKLGKTAKKMRTSDKQQFARSVDGVCRTVSQVIEFLAAKQSTMPTAAPKGAVGPKTEKSNKEKIVATKNVVVTEKIPHKTAKSSDSEDSEDEEQVKSVGVTSKPVATVKPILRKEEQVEKPVKKIVESSSEDEPMEEDAASLPQTKVKGEKRKADGAAATPAKKSKLDVELEKYKDVDPTTLDPLESRKVAMLKLQKRIEDMKGNRKGKSKSDVAMDQENERKMKRRMSKLKMKQRKQEERQKHSGEDKKLDSKPAKPEANEVNLPVTEDGKVVYSKFDFIVKDPKKRHLGRAEKKEKFSGKNYKALLNKVEQRDEKIASLMDKDPEKAKQMQDEIKWNRALKKAEGVKVKDDKSLLKKGLKYKEKFKEKRLAKWENRVQQVESDKATRQDKRDKNLQKRKDDKKKSKVAKMRTKGRIL